MTNSPTTDHIDRHVMLASPCNFEAMDAELEVNQNGLFEKIATKSERTRNNRFKRLVRMIMTNTIWAKEAAIKAQKVKGGFKTASGEKLTFNLNAFRANIQTCGKLSTQSIDILSKPSNVRDEDEVKIIQKIVYRLKCFDRYPIIVKQELARVIYYDKFEDDRLIIKQGHSGVSFYFIVSGAVVVERMELDPFINEYYTQRIGELQAGDSFGELALLHNTKRAASIVCRGVSEFLRVDKPDFDEVLRTCHQREWEIRINLLSTHSVFQGWTTKELKIANGHAKMKTYPPNTVIVSEKKFPSDRIFFIASGKCSVVRRIELIRRFLLKNKYKYLLPPINQITMKNEKFNQSTAELPVSLQNHHTILPGNVKQKRIKRRLLTDVAETRYFVISELTDGDYFNVGEDMDGLYVISKGRVEVVQVGKLAFSRSNGGVLEEMRTCYIKKLPTFNEACQKYISDEKWKSFKKNLVKTVVEEKGKSHAVKPTDVPGVTKSEQAYYQQQKDII